MALANQYERAYRAWPILARVAQKKEKITYGDLANDLGIHHRPVRFLLEEIQSYCRREQLPPLTILVVNQSGIIGKGFTAWNIDDLDAGLQKVYAFDWSGIQNPFAFASDGTNSKRDFFCFGQAARNS